MRIFFLFFISVLFICNCLQAQVPQPKVDELVELLSIVFRMAGAKEYVNKGVPSYDREVDSLFTPFENHKLIAYAKIHPIRKKLRLH